MKPIRAVLLLMASVSLLASCTSIPLSTIAKFATFNRENFVALKPNDVRVKVTVPQGFVIDPSKIHIKVRLKEEAKEVADIDEALELRLLQSSPSMKDAGLFQGEMAVTEFELVLSDKGQQLMRSIQKTPRTEAKRTLSISVSKDFLNHFLKRPPAAQSITFWIEMQLSKLDGYFVLVDGAKFDLKEIDRAMN